MKYSFSDLNETASIERLEGAGKLFRLQYTNPFYGSCMLRLELDRQPGGQILVNRSSIQIESYELKKGDLNSLLNVSLRFLVQKTAKQREILDGLTPLVTPSWLGWIRSWFASGRPAGEPAPYENRNTGAT